MEFRPHKSKMYVIWKNDKIYCNTESIWTDKYWKQTNGCRFKMTDTQNVLFWLNLKFSAFFLNQNISPNSHIFMFSAIYLLFYWTGFVTDRKDIPLNRWIAPIQGIFLKLRAKFQTITYANSHLLKNHKFPLSEARKAIWIYFLQKMNFSWRKYFFIWPMKTLIRTYFLWNFRVFQTIVWYASSKYMGDI